MAKTKSKEDVKDTKKELKEFLSQKLPTLFDRTPTITGNLDKLVEEILEIVQ